MAIILNDSFEKKEKNVSHAEHNSNPGNIKYYSGNTKKLSKTAQFLINKGFNIKPGSKAKDGGQFIWFANKEDGLKAAQLFWTEARTWPIYKDLTVDQALKKYSGSGYTAKELGINGTALLKDLSEAELANMMNKQIKREDRKVYDTLVEDKLIVEPTSKLTLDDYAESLFKGKELTPEIANEVKEFTKDRKGYAKKQLAKVSAEVEAISERDGRIIGENNEAFNELVKKYGEGVTRLAIEQYNEEPKAINEKLQSQIVSLQNEAIEIDKLNNTLSDIKSKVIKGDFKKVLAQRNKLNYERNQKIYKLENEYLDKKIANQEKQLSNVNLTGNERKAVQEEILSLRKSKQGLITRSKIPAKSYPQTVNDVRNELSQDLPNVLKKKVLAEIPFEEKKPTDAPKKDADEVGVIELTPEQIAEAENDNAGDEKKEKTKPTDDDFEDFLNNFAQGEIIKPDTFKYDKKDFKKQNNG